MYQEGSHDTIEALREALRDYYGTAMQENPMAVIELSGIDNMSDPQILELSEKLGLRG